MGMNLARTGTAAVVGIASGMLAVKATTTLSLGTNMAVSYATVAEAVSLVAGAALQALSPYTMPDIVDGLVDGGAALLLRRGAVYAQGKKETLAARTGTSAWAAPLYGSPSAYNVASPCARGAVGSVGNTARRELA